MVKIAVDILKYIIADFFKKEGEYLINLEDSETAEYEVDEDDKLLKTLIYKNHDMYNPYIHDHEGEFYQVYYIVKDNNYTIIIEKP
jgi:hypothetical protein